MVVDSFSLRMLAPARLLITNTGPDPYWLFSELVASTMGSVLVVCHAPPATVATDSSVPPSTRGIGRRGIRLRRESARAADTVAGEECRGLHVCERLGNIVARPREPVDVDHVDHFGQSLRDLRLRVQLAQRNSRLADVGHRATGKRCWTSCPRRRGCAGNCRARRGRRDAPGNEAK